MPKMLLPMAATVAVAAALLAAPADAVHRSDASAAASASAVTDAHARRAGNPFAAHPWGVYEGKMEPSWVAWNNATDPRKKNHLAYIATQAKDHWFGHWNPNDKIAEQVQEYIQNSQDGNPDALVQMAIFRVVPWEHDACNRLPTAAEKASYKQWIDRFAGAVGNTPTAIVLQPDGPFALCAPHGSKAPSKLVRYAARVLSAQPNTSVYIEAGAADWPMFGKNGGVNAAVKILVRGGIRYTRGFALNGTHYDSIPNEVARAKAIIKMLNAKGYTGRTVVINTSNNGHPFKFGQYTGADPTNPVVCKSKDTPARRTCETLGIPPTSDVAAARWGLPAKTANAAAKFVDAYLWFGRPWLHHEGSQPFVTKRAIKLVKTTPYS
jgi:endoglucanase